MRKSKKFALAASACMTMLAFAIAGTVGVLKVSANGGLSSDVTVNLVEPTAGTFTVFTDDGLAPATFPVEAEALVTPITNMSITPTVDSVDFVLNPATLDGSSTTADQVVAGVTSNPSGSPSDWEGVVDIGRASNYAVDGVTGLLTSNSVVAALARISGAYGSYRASVTAYDEFDSVAVNIEVVDATDVNLDPNGNGRPDAEGLAAFPNGTFISGSGGNVVISIWRPLDTSRGAITSPLTQVLDTADGSVFVEFTAPTLTAIIAADASYNIYNEGRLLVTLAGNPTNLLDGPAGVNPLGEFGTGATAGFPAPRNIFALVNILLRDTAVSPAEWLSLKQLPAGAPPIVASMDGLGVEAALAALGAGAEIYGFDYDTTGSQDASGNISDVGDQMGWEEVTTTLARVTVTTGEDTIMSTLASASVIWSSSAAPRSTTLSGSGGGGGGGTCFIATAAYGTPLADDIYVLRAVRDSYMLNNALGAAFVDTYYRLSPPVADVVANNAVMKAAVRTVLTPVVIVGSFVLAMPGLSVVLLLAWVALVVARVRRRTTGV